MTITASGCYAKYSEENYKKSPQELMGDEKIAKLEKKHGEIKGFTKVKEYRCSRWLNECECGYDEFRRNRDFQYCPQCGEMLYYESIYPEKTPHQITTAKSKEEAIDIFYKKCAEDVEKEDIKCIERIIVYAYFTEVPKYGDGYQANNKEVK